MCAAMLKRSALIRRTEKSKPWRRKPDDKVTEAVANEVAARDRMCVLFKLDSNHLCYDRFGNRIAPDSYYELDHVDNGGTGKRGSSTVNNLVRLCPYAHILKTQSARFYRPILRRYLDEIAAA